MLAIALWQPWATLMAIEEKRFETRGWNTDVRGQVVVYATKKTSDPRFGRFDEIFYSEPFYAVLSQAGFRQFEDLPLGALLSIHDLRSVWKADIKAAFLRNTSMDKELAFGDFSPGRFAFEMPLIKRFANPIPFQYPVKGPSKFFEVSEQVIKEALYVV
jgi:hypothetical protein